MNEVKLRGLSYDAKRKIKRHGEVYDVLQDRTIKHSGRRVLRLQSLGETRQVRGVKSKFTWRAVVGEEVAIVDPEKPLGIDPVETAKAMRLACSGCKEFDLAMLHSAVYFLVKNNQVVYVGQTINLPARIVAHQSAKDFDRVFYFDVPREHLDFVEGAFIRKLKPALNGNEGSGWGVLDEEILKTYTLPLQ